MDKFNSAGVEIALESWGEGPAILLIHGFASNRFVNWRDTGWVKTLTEAGFRAIALDNRGHGESEKLYEPARYVLPEMAEDARRLLDHLAIGQAHVMGYSMGARIAAFLAIGHPARIGRLVLGGLAGNMIRGLGNGPEIAAALEADDARAVANGEARAFRIFAEQTKSDRLALAACMKAGRTRIGPEALARIAAPTLVVAGELDGIAGDVGELVAAIPGARGLTLARRNHMNAVGDREFKAAVVAFLAET
jgi:pimeloyl-ACP methyl ester carboxylesterase